MCCRSLATEVFEADSLNLFYPTPPSPPPSPRWLPAFHRYFVLCAQISLLKCLPSIECRGRAFVGVSAQGPWRTTLRQVPWYTPYAVASSTNSHPVTPVDLVGSGGPVGVFGRGATCWCVADSVDARSHAFNPQFSFVVYHGVRGKQPRCFCRCH